MRLLYQTHSPYARKVLVLAYEVGLQDRLTVIHHETSPTRRNEAVFDLNPLGKVPVLICDDGIALFDSNVICEYLDGLTQAPGSFHPSRGFDSRRSKCRHSRKASRMPAISPAGNPSDGRNPCGGRRCMQDRSRRSRQPVISSNCNSRSGAGRPAWVPTA